MSFYRRYNGFGAPAVVDASNLPASVHGAVPGSGGMPVFPSPNDIFRKRGTELEYTGLPVRRGQLPLMADPQTRADFSGFYGVKQVQALVSATMPPVVPGPAKPITNRHSAAAAAQIAANSEERARRAADAAGAAAATRDEAAYQASKAAAKAAVDPQISAQADAERARKIAQAEHTKTLQAAEVARITQAKADADAAAAQQAAYYQQSSGGGGAVPDVAWDQQTNQMETAPVTPVPEPAPDVRASSAAVDIATITQPKSSQFATMAAGAGGGLLLGGPIGMLMGAAAGYFLGKPKAQTFIVDSLPPAPLPVIDPYGTQLNAFYGFGRRR